MLLNLHVKNLAIIEDEEVEFGEGLNVLTGETGAGKSLLLGSVNLALGGRADSTLIRQGAEYALVEMTFDAKKEQIRKHLADEEVYPEDGCVVLGRRIMEGRSKARINGESVSASTLSSAAGLLLDIHGQQDSQILLKRRNHLDLLDEYGGAKGREQRAAVSEIYGKYALSRKELESFSMDEESRARSLELLQYEIQEIEDAGLKPGEDDLLEMKYRRMANAKKITEEAGESYRLIAEDDSASDRLDKALGLIRSVSGYDDELSDIQSHMAEAESVLSDCARELGRYLERLDFSEEDFSETEERLNTINHLKDKYGQTIDEILSCKAAKEEEAGRLLNYEEYCRKKNLETESLYRELADASGVLTALRKTYAAAMEKEIADNLRDLNFPDAHFLIELENRKEPGPEGAEDAQFLISMNPGEPLKPLEKIASGGELSRIMLAVRTVMADKDDVPTLIFDEIDAGISGRTAQLVAEKLHFIARHRQVICITHLAQIAAMADHHYVIDKETDGSRTNTHVRELNDAESAEELARILGGTRITETTRMNAREMKELAKSAADHV